MWCWQPQTKLKKEPKHCHSSFIKHSVRKNSTTTAQIDVTWTWTWYSRTVCSPRVRAAQQHFTWITLFLDFNLFSWLDMVLLRWQLKYRMSHLRKMTRGHWTATPYPRPARIRFVERHKPQCVPFSDFSHRLIGWNICIINFRMNNYCQLRCGFEVRMHSSQYTARGGWDKWRNPIYLL